MFNGKAVVLVVENSAIIRMGAVDLVQSAGYEAIEASNADEAIRILESRADIDLVFTDVPGRVAKALLELSQRFGVPGPDGLHVHHDLTQEELAQLVGASRETVNKALAEFAQRGWIRLEQKSVTLTDVDRLLRRSK